MPRKLLAISMAVILLVALGLAGVALANSNFARFSAQGALTQTSIGQTPQPVLNKQGQLVGLKLTGEVFQGSLGACTNQAGQACSAISSAPMTAVQDANLRYTGLPNPVTGTIGFAGSIDGTFTIGSGANSAEGEYEGFVHGTLTPLPPPYPTGAMLISGGNNARWEITKAIGTFSGLEGASGTFNGYLGGIFPGAEQFTFTIQGSTAGQDNHQGNNQGESNNGGDHQGSDR